MEDSALIAWGLGLLLITTVFWAAVWWWLPALFRDHEDARSEQRPTKPQDPAERPGPARKPPR